jgi:hypothetical protein
MLGLPRMTGEARNALRTRISLRSRVFVAICYDSCMRKAAVYSMVLVLSALGFAGSSHPQSNSGTLEFLARVTPTAARPEPVRQFTFYVLTKSYTEIVKEVEDKDPLPPRNEFIETLKISPALKSWLKEHEILDLTMPDTDKAITPEDIMRVPEFQAAYERSNSGGVTDGFPRPKYTEAEKTEHPDKYEKHKQEYTLALKKFVQAHPGTISGMELELDAVNPQKKWAALQSVHHKRVQRTAPDTAQTKFLAGKADTDLEGRAAVSGLPPGKYWISTINLDAAAGDMRLRWDVPVVIQAGQTTRVELTNLNSIDAHGENP